MQNVTSEIEKTRTINTTANIVCDGITKSAWEKEGNNPIIIVSSTKDDIPNELYTLTQWNLVC